MVDSLTAESVCPGHPDKLADRISDAILDAALCQNPCARVACEVLVTANIIHVAGEISGVNCLPYDRLVREVLDAVGYRSWFPKTITSIQHQSLNISRAINSQGAGDIGTVYGYATVSTKEKLPKAVVLAHAVTRLLSLHSGPDGKAQVTVVDGEVNNAFISVHASDVSLRLQEDIEQLLCSDKICFSPFSVGGAAADTGLTGRKCQVDTYGGAAAHGGGAFSGKDPSKTDRSGAYMARWLAKGLLKTHGLSWVQVGLSYGFGLAEPLWVDVQSSSAHNRDIAQALLAFDLRPQSIIERFDLLRPIYESTSCFGHFGREEFPWEKVL